MILNLGAGDQEYGNIRADLTPSKSTNLICDAHILPFQDEVFDEVYTANLFEHLTNPGLSLKEMTRVLKQKGLITIITDNASYWRFHLRSKSAHMNYQGRSEKDQHFMLFMPFHLKNFLSYIGLSDIKICYVAEKPYRITGTINWVLRRLPLFKRFSYGRFKATGVKASD